MTCAPHEKPDVSGFVVEYRERRLLRLRPISYADDPSVEAPTPFYYDYVTLSGHVFHDGVIIEIKGRDH